MLGPLQPFNTIGYKERAAVNACLSEGPLSGYLAGRERSNGYFVEQLEEEWADVFHVKHAIACNSCTSGLLAACAISGVNQHNTVLVPAITMSATAAAPKHLGANIIFGDIDPGDFCLREYPGRWDTHSGQKVRAIIVTNLFGHPGRLRDTRLYCDQKGITLIEDNAQAILAMENGQYTGTIGHVGVFSLNVHKHIQSGEGGMVCTNDEEIAHKLRGFINHGENMGLSVGLNLRMPELCAAVAVEQLRRASEIVGSRVEQAKKLIKATEGVSGLLPPNTRDGCTHSYYHVAWRWDGYGKWQFMRKLIDAGFPVRDYVPPLYRIGAFSHGSHSSRDCFEAERMFDEVFIFENCAWNLTNEQIEKVGELFHG